MASIREEQYIPASSFIAFMFKIAAKPGFQGRFRKGALFALLLSACPEPALTQDAEPDGIVIEDNSFLIEEAYNQEPGVIQHISNFIYDRSGATDGFVYALTEEWPIAGQTHQLGFTLPYLRHGAIAGEGIGDILVNYRYQLTGADEPVTIAPRLSVILPTGDEPAGEGDGVVGFQVNLPVSARISGSFVAHFNAGYTMLPGVAGTDAGGVEISRTLSAFSAGGSVIWLAFPRLNFLLEGLVIHAGELGHDGDVENRSEFILNPAVRGAIDFGSLQVAPGFGVPFTMTDGKDPEPSLFFYLSFEHPL